jgi:hypothetical protein
MVTAVNAVEAELIVAGDATNHQENGERWCWLLVGSNSRDVITFGALYLL